jgi:predicted TIM-barrel fold metal-dependent hydrolase
MSDYVVDAHMHLWNVAEHDWYPGLRAFADQLARPELYADFLVQDYRLAAGDLPVRKLVHVSGTTEPRAYLQETPWVDALAEAHGLELVIIGTIEPSLSPAEIEADLEQQAQCSRFRGVRVLYEFTPDSEAARVVLAWLQERDLIFDLVTQPDQMGSWLETLSHYPELTVSLEHTGWPAGTDADARAAWLQAITACAQQTRALCKVSGLGMATGDLSVDALRPWVELAVETFGWDRVAFGSNVPIEHLAGPYGELQHSLETILSAASEDERARFYAGNAERVYRL